jgi:hypothetical protein
VPTFAYGSGRPFNTLVSSDLYATGAYPLTARPAGIERNTQRLRPTAALDLRAFKEFHPHGERARLQVGTEVFNLLNHANALRALPYARTPGNRAIDGFGRAFDFSNARQIQLFLHFEF